MKLFSLSFPESTALHLSTYNNHRDVAELLLHHGADIEAINDEGKM